MTEWYFEDFEKGRVIDCGQGRISEEEAIAFAQKFDPQYFHVDKVRAVHSPFGKLVVSGWHTAVFSMNRKALSDMRFVAGGMVGMGLEQVKWPKPVVPNTLLHVWVEITGKRPSNSKPTHGIVHYNMRTHDEAGDAVFQCSTAIWVPRRTGQKGE